MKPITTHTLAARPVEPTDLELLDLHPAAADVRAEVLAGLAATQKSLPCKFFYDARGSQLFDAICELPEYYPTRTETRILDDFAGEMAEAVGPRPLLVEYGSGSSNKTRPLLDALHHPAGYVPIDISRSHLLQSARTLATAYPKLTVRPVCADYTRPFDLPEFAADPGRVVAYFPGSTIGNFEPAAAKAFLTAMRHTCGPGSALLIGVDLKKEPSLLHAAYNDTSGITAAFNLNVLRRVNRDVGTDFDESAFAHHAFYNVPAGRMEMHLVARRAQRVRLDNGDTVTIAEGESIHTENCYKYTVPSFQALAASAGYAAQRVWTDERGWFSVHYLTAE